MGASEGGHKEKRPSVISSKSAIAQMPNRPPDIGYWFEKDEKGVSGKVLTRINMRTITIQDYQQAFFDLMSRIVAHNMYEDHIIDVVVVDEDAQS